MRPMQFRPWSLVVGLALSVTGALPSYADDSEIFYGQTTSASAPNIMFILDTSGSMSTPVTTTVDYAPSQTYSGSGSCSGIGNRVYYSTNGTAPSCDSNNYFLTSDLKCADAIAKFAVSGYGVGTYLRWSKGNGNNGKYSWQINLSPNNSTGADVECLADAGIDGNLTSTNPYPLTGSFSNTPAGQWTNVANSSAWKNTNGTPATLYTGNYITWSEQYQTTTLGTRMSILKSAATSLLNSLSGVNVGLMRYDSNASGGMVAYQVSPIETSRSGIITALNGYSAGGNTPLSETLYEAYRYFSGGQVYFGDTSSPFHSVAASRTPATSTGSNYDSPSDYSCQKNAIVYLTDGLPTADYQADTLIQNLANFSTLASPGCDAATTDVNSSTGGQCLGALAQYMYNADLRSDVTDQQNVTTYFIGFGTDFASGGSLSSAFNYLSAAATRGGGKAYQASDSSTLTNALTGIVTKILDESTSFTAPTVAVNAFNRTQTLDDLYVSVFQPSSNLHWPGNVKKYKITNGVIVDKNGAAAVDPSTDYIKNSAQSYWSTSADGKSVTAGGAANVIPDPTVRKVYTYISTTTKPSSAVTLTGSSYSFDTANTLITNTVLGIDGTSDPIHDKLINWARGQDVNNDDADSNGDTTDARHVMGDPMHAQPGIVIYSGTAQNPVGVIFQPTNDGYLHAIDTTDGHELWSFIPQELLSNLKDIYYNATSTTKHYVLDGSVRVYRYDANGDGQIVAADGDQVIIYFSQGRGGSNYYALDVTDKNAPKFMWSLGAADLPGIGQSWSRPTLANVNISGATQNSKKQVLIMGGGYDAAEENTTFTTYVSPATPVGNAIYMVDAISGNLLWSASKSGATLNLTRMDHSIPSDISVIDLDGDNYADRMYVGDMAGQLWSFDIYNGSTAANLVTGGVIASLGTYSDTTHTVANTRRFYSAPDVSYMRNSGGNPYFNIAIGSGYRGHPLNTTIQDRFYSIRQYQPFAKRTQAQYTALTETGASHTIVLDSDLTDITLTPNTTLAQNVTGWKLLLNQPNSTWVGEKVLAGATTFNGIIYFPTYIPSLTASNSCSPSAGANRIYAVDIASGKPAWPIGTTTGSGSSSSSGTTTQTTTDRWQESAAPGILSDVMTLFPAGQPPQCVSGTNVINCTSGASLTKSSWRDSASQ